MRYLQRFFPEKATVSKKKQRYTQKEMFSALLTGIIKVALKSK